MKRTNSTPTRRQQPERNDSPAVIRDGELYPLDEVGRRLRWRRHSIRQALRAGLRTTKFGSRRYVTGAAVLDLMDRLADEQARPQGGDA